MSTRRRTRGWQSALVGLLAAIWVAPGCGTYSNPSSPSGLPSPERPAPPPVATGPAPTIVSITPSLGSTFGGSWIAIFGTGLQRGVRVTFGDAAAGMNARFDSRYTDRIYLDTPGHAAGAVDVVVTNPDRQSGRAAGAYMFAPPASFDVDGEWGGFTPLEEWLTFTVAAGAVVSLSCGDSGVIALSAPAPVRDGEFSHTDGSGVTITGRIVARGQSVGRVNIDRCTNTEWRAERRPSVP